MGNLRSMFDSDGYVSIKSFLDKNEVDELRQETLRFIDEEVPDLPPDVVYCEKKDDYSTLKQVQRLNEFDNYFRDDVAIDQEAHDQYQRDLNESLRKQSKI